MKKIYFSLLAIITFTFANAQIINFPDANFKAKLLQASPSNQIAANTSNYFFKIDSNNDGQIQVAEALLVGKLYLDNSSIFDLTGINNFMNLNYLNCSSNQLTSLDVSNLVNLNTLTCSNNQLNSLNVNNLVNLNTLTCSNNQLTSLNVNDLVNLLNLNCSQNQLTSLDVSNLLNLNTLYFNLNQLASIDVNNLMNLHNLNCSQNQLTSIDVSNLISLNILNLQQNQLSSLDVSNLVNLNTLICAFNQLTTLNVSNLVNLNQLSCNNNQLISLFIKNKVTNWLSLSFSNPTLLYVCADDDDILFYENRINLYGLTNCHVTSYCSFTPGGTFYTIQGNSRLDSNDNGCDINDIYYPNLKFNITSGTNFKTFISNLSGNYSIPVTAGTYTFTPQLENPSYFTVSPTSASVNFPTIASPFTQNFCVTANGVHHDLETVIIPINAARPGFDATYKIKFKNKGNQVENASLDFNYNDTVLDLISSSVAPTSQNTDFLNWNLGTLNPFQEGEVIVTFNLNSPMETPALNGGDVLGFDAIISPIDDNYPNNHSSLKQTVVNSFDPNDKTCLEGNTINSSMIGEYLHYMIRFENTGTFPAENIVVKDMIDTTKFDVSTLQMTDASHACFTRIDGNKVEFIFENINLDFNDATNDGYVVFKIKTLPTLAINAQVTNNANIYFDYNFPITTNTATSTFTTLANNSIDFDTYFTLAPIPAKDILTISNKQNANISSISVYNILGQVVLTTTNPSETIDVSSLKTGNYFIKVTSDKGISSSKFIKE